MPKVRVTAIENPAKKKRRRAKAKKSAPRRRRAKVTGRKNPGPSRQRIAKAVKRQGYVIRGYGKNRWWYFTGNSFDESERKATVYYSRPGAYHAVKMLRGHIPAPLKTLGIHPA